jgi:threonine dehydratase
MLTYKLPPDAVAVAICSGANMTFEKLQYVAERTLLGSGKEALYAIKLPEEPGALRKLCTNVINGHNVTEFNYRLHTRDRADIFTGIAIRDDLDKQRFERMLAKNGYEFTDMTHHNVAKEHIRHMIGGHRPNGVTERIYAMEFPERPGAMQAFVNTLADSCNISLFHYRGQGADTGKVLVGLEAASKTTVERLLNKTGFPFQDVTDDPSVKLFTQ